MAGAGACVISFVLPSSPPSPLAVYVPYHPTLPSKLSAPPAPTMMRTHAPQRNFARPDQPTFQEGGGAAGLGLAVPADWIIPHTFSSHGQGPSPRPTAPRGIHSSLREAGGRGGSSGGEEG